MQSTLVMSYTDTRKMIEFYNQFSDMLNSPFAFPRLPPGKPRQSLGVSKTGMLKESIIRDNAQMLARLSGFNSVFRQHAASLFDLVPANQFDPTHPLHFRMNPMESLQSENEQLKKENAVLKKDLEKTKQK